MSMTVVLLGPGERSVELDAQVATRLSRLGITEATLVDGPSGAALVLSGWDFDARAHAAAVAELVAPDREATLLHSVVQVALSPKDVPGRTT